MKKSAILPLLHFNKIIFCLLLTLLFSCNDSESYLLTYQSKLRIIEREDHQRCVSQGMDNGEWDEISTEMYWRCRYNLVNARKNHGNITPASIKNNYVIEKISEEMLKNLSRAKYSAMVKLEDNLDLNDHKKCLAKGGVTNIVKLSDEYYLCRQDLVIARIPPAPKVTGTYELAILPKERALEYSKIYESNRPENKEALAVAEILQKYPLCSELNIHSVDFKTCSEATDQSNKCLANIGSLKIKKDLQDKIDCSRQAFIQFPDNYALSKDKSSSEIERLKADIKKNQGAVAKDLNETLLYLEGDRNLSSNIGKDVEIDDEKKYKKKLYGRVELLKLRERFIYQCGKKMGEKIPEFIKQSTEDCMSIAKNWVKNS